MVDIKCVWENVVDTQGTGFWSVPSVCVRSVRVFSVPSVCVSVPSVHLTPCVTSRSVRVEASQVKDGLSGVELLLTPVKRKDSGKYRCRARVDGRDEEVSFELIVLRELSSNCDSIVSAVKL